MDKKLIEKFVNAFETSIIPFQEIAEKWSYGDFAIFFDGICSKNIYGFETLIKPLFNYQLSDDKVFLMIEKYPSIFKELPQKFLTEATYRTYISSAKSKNMLPSAIRQNGGYKFTPKCATIALEMVTELQEYEALINKITATAEADGSQKDFAPLLKQMRTLKEYCAGSTKLEQIEQSVDQSSDLVISPLFLTKLGDISKKRLLDFVEEKTKGLPPDAEIKKELLERVEKAMANITERLGVLAGKYAAHVKQGVLGDDGFGNL